MYLFLSDPAFGVEDYGLTEKGKEQAKLASDEIDKICGARPVTFETIYWMNWMKPMKPMTEPSLGEQYRNPWSAIFKGNIIDINILINYRPHWIKIGLF